MGFSDVCAHFSLYSQEQSFVKSIADTLPFYHISVDFVSPVQLRFILMRLNMPVSRFKASKFCVIPKSDLKL